MIRISNALGSIDRKQAAIYALLSGLLVISASSMTAVVQGPTAEVPELVDVPADPAVHALELPLDVLQPANRQIRAFAADCRFPAVLRHHRTTVVTRLKVQWRCFQSIRYQKLRLSIDPFQLLSDPLKTLGTYS